MIVLGTQKDTIIKGFELAGVVDALDHDFPNED